MSKRNLTLGSASGKLGSVVYMRRRGQQIARLLVSSPHDPKSIAQCIIRARFANYVAIWRRLRPFVAPTWRGVSRYGSQENAFYKHNRSLMPTASATMSRLGYAYPNLGLVTYGSLPIINSYEFLNAAPVQGSGVWPAVYWPYPVSGSAPTNVASLFSMLQDWGIGVERGDIMHFLLYQFYFDGGGASPAGGEAGEPRIMHASFELSSTNSTALTAAIPFLGATTGLNNKGERIVGWNLPSRMVLPIVGGYSASWALAIWYERPRNPQYSRYTRSRFAIETPEDSMLEDLATKDQLATAYAETYQNI